MAYNFALILIQQYISTHSCILLKLFPIDRIISLFVAIWTITIELELCHTQKSFVLE